MRADRRLHTRLRATVLAVATALGATGSANAECSAIIPASVQMDPGSRVLFYGDSITVGILGTPYHYAALVRHLLAAAYCDFELLEIEAIGQRGSHYIRYARRIGRDLLSSEIPYDWVMFQDSGRALRLAFENDPDSPRSFPVAVQATIDQARLAAPSLSIMLASTPPLDHAHATASWEVRYERVNDFVDHNMVLEDIAATGGHTIVDWAGDACRAYSQAPDAEWTKDGVHPQALGEVLFALSIVRALGVPRADLQLDDLTQFHPMLDETTVSTVANWIYGSDPSCD
ncbi:MAG TPA: GDSL-type esterase/lipase family protein [Candidatus Limnocylindrales bacterium]|nr:GDSL-type esterase/lipase family protein [Candidatus Limnocylindrales bacterium]